MYLHSVKTKEEEKGTGAWPGFADRLDSRQGKLSNMIGQALERAALGASTAAVARQRATLELARVNRFFKLAFYRKWRVKSDRTVFIFKRGGTIDVRQTHI